MEESIKAEGNRRPDGTFGPNNNANPAGRPKGQSLKEFWKQRFTKMDEDERIAFTEKVGNEVIWKMAEGNPATTADITSGGQSFFSEEHKQKANEAIKAILSSGDTE
jgi:hypothetical protein